MRLKDMFERQRTLQKRLGTKADQRFISDMCLALHAETTELLDSTPWKPWKKNQKLDKANALYEIADILHFTINIALALGFTEDDVYNEFVRKNKENHKRQDEGY